MIPNPQLLEQAASEGWKGLRKHFPNESRSTIRNWLSKCNIKVNTKYRQVRQEEIEFINSIRGVENLKKFYQVYLVWCKENNNTPRSPKSFRSFVYRYWRNQFEDIPLKLLCKKRTRSDLLLWHFVMVKFCDDYPVWTVPKIKAYELESFLYKKLEKKFDNYFNLRLKMEKYYPCKRDYYQTLMAIEHFLGLSETEITTFIKSLYNKGGCNEDLLFGDRGTK